MLRAMAVQLVKLQDIERLSPRVIRILGGNPGKFTLQGTNTYLVGQGAKRLLIDTGEGKPEWAQALRKALTEENATIDQTVLTHWHPDHVGGVDDVLSICGKEVKVFKNQPWDDQSHIKDGDRFTTQGATLRAFHCPGHTTDHMALILEEEDAMFTGDNVLGQGTAVFEDLKTYMDSLDKMQHQFNGRAYPGHGPVIEDGKAKVQEYIKHRKEREEQVLSVLRGRSGSGAESWGSMDMVKVIYKDYPEHLHTPAEGSLLQVLQKLKKDGRVVQVDEDGPWSLTSKSAL